jgi:hypothetical protein
MPEAPLVSQHTVSRVVGASRLQRLLRAGRLAPRERTPSRVLFSQRDVHAALQRLEREACPPDRIEVSRVRAWEQRTGRGYIRKERKVRRPAWDLELDLNALSSYKKRL